MQAMKLVREPHFLGTIAVTLVIVLGVAASIVYINPPGNKTITFYTDDASSITPGITVRIAGITVGKVKALDITPDQVRVRATIDGTAFIGEQSTVSVRMLTVVGGYYVNIDSLGDKPLGDKPIPKDRVILPYSLIQTLADTTRITETLQTAPINQSLNQIQRGLTGDNLEAISAIVDAGTTLTSTLDHQRGQLSTILNMSDEYIERLSNYRGQLQQLVEKIAILEQTLMLYGKGFAAAMEGMGKILQGVGPLGDFYMHHREQFLEKFTHWQQVVRTWADRNGLIVRILHRTRDRMMNTLAAQNAPAELLATDLCIPVPGGQC